VVAAPQVRAQISGDYHSAPGATASYQYHAGVLHNETIPLDVSFQFSNGNPTSQLTATIHKPIISVTTGGQSLFPIANFFPMTVTGTSSNGIDFSGDLLGTQYLFRWKIEPAADNELTWNGTVAWYGGRYELTTIANVSLLPGLAGDFNGDGAVDDADYVAWRKGPGAISQPVNYNSWRSHYGNATGSGLASGGVVPEPTATVLLVTGAVLSICRRRAMAEISSGAIA
jgi:hypothetical protein